MALPPLATATACHLPAPPTRPLRPTSLLHPPAPLPLPPASAHVPHAVRHDVRPCAVRTTTLRGRTGLAGALSNDAKLRELFDRIDIDKGGTIDRNELQTALCGAGKALSDEQIDTMLLAADGDGNAEIDFDEFANILRGVKAANAAAVIHRSFHKNHRKRSAAVAGATAAVATAGSGRGAEAGARRPSSVLGAAATNGDIAGIANGKANGSRGHGGGAGGGGGAAALSKLEFEHRLGQVLLSRQIEPAEAVRSWDRKHKGALTRIEFRLGVREALGLTNATSKDIDAIFDEFDTDHGGTIDVPARDPHTPAAPAALCTPCTVRPCALR